MMSDDIVKRMRAPCWAGHTIIEEAAEEIERLRAEFARAQGRTTTMIDIVERLRRAAVIGMAGNDALMREAAEEIERLRAAANRLLVAMDDMHEGGETFTARVSLSAAALREALLR